MQRPAARHRYIRRRQEAAADEPCTRQAQQAQHSRPEVPAADPHRVYDLSLDQADKSRSSVHHSRIRKHCNATVARYSPN